MCLCISSQLTIDSNASGSRAIEIPANIKYRVAKSHRMPALLQVIFRRGATNYKAILRKMTYIDKAFYGFPPPSIYFITLCIIIYSRVDLVGSSLQLTSDSNNGGNRAQQMSANANSGAGLFNFGYSYPHCSTLQHAATHCSALQHVVTCCDTLQHCNTLQHTETHCNTLRYRIRSQDLVFFI